MAQWRSDVLPWLAVGGALGIGWLIAVTDNASRPRVRQNFYNSQQECVQDYTSEQCTSVDGHNRYGTYSGYYGPAYYTRNPPQGDPGPGRTALSSSDGRSTTAASASEIRVSRGGFGSTARSGRGGYYGG